MTEFKKGDLIVFKTHPFIEEHLNIKISASPDYTSPILVIKEVKEKSFEKETGNNNGELLNCMFYNSRDGKFIEKWISSFLVNKILFTVTTHKFLKEINLKKKLTESTKELNTENYENLIKASYLNKKVVLKSVDLELLKIKINRTKENGDLVETNHLEFLPPVMTVIGFKYTDEKNKYCDKTGLPAIELKCKWYNSSLKTFSELLFPYNILYSVKETQELLSDKDLLADISESLKKNSFFILPLAQKFALETDDNNTTKGTVITNAIAQSNSISFKHYFYEMNHFDYVIQQKSNIAIEQSFKTVDENELFGNRYPNYKKGYKSKISDCKFKLENYYYLSYKDSYNNLTKRIIKVKELFIYIKDLNIFRKRYKNLKDWSDEDGSSYINFNYLENGEISIYLQGAAIINNVLPKTTFEDDNLEIMIHSNCLLRKGKIRNFKVKNILEAIEIKDGKTVFEELS